MEKINGVSIHITGIVQGVGFRPFIYLLATEMGLAGWVRNTSAGVDIQLDANSGQVDAFINRIRKEAPPLATIDEVHILTSAPYGYTAFEILQSQQEEGAFQPVSPDISVCPDCLGDLFSPGNRRYAYPFTNCTNCGPRFTIIKDIPYDRPMTTMADFDMCPECYQEYTDPLDRRFHAQPIACPVCGPQVWLEVSNPHNLRYPSPDIEKGQAAILAAQRLLKQGKILAVKGLGGFHLACDATNSEAVSELRRRKLRVDKPFALMLPDIDEVSKQCALNQWERELLESRQRPITILERLPGSNIVSEVAPCQNSLGVMLPYTPLHYLLFQDNSPITGLPASQDVSLTALVMTSGNLSEEPIATDNGEARARLADLADAFLMHNRPIHVRCDDSVVRTFNEAIYPMRRSRGYAPFPVRLPIAPPPILAVGAELKNTFCLTRDDYAFLSHHIGDMENYETLQSFHQGIEHFERLFRVQPAVLAYDMHPNYLASRYALERAERQGLTAIGVQHHHAHLAACMAEHGLTGDQPVIGVIFDGTGYGTDGGIWGGEFLLADYRSFQRLAHLRYTPLPGGDAAIRKPARTALAHLWTANLDWELPLPCVGALCPEERITLRSQLEHNINAPLTSSIGRLFDAAAALIGVRQVVNYEAQAAIELEALVDPLEIGAYRFAIQSTSDNTSPYPLQTDPGPLFRAMIQDWLAGLSPPILAARFHNGIVEMVVDVCKIISSDMHVSQVVLSGGVWQNMLLLHRAVSQLQKAGFNVLIHRQAPTNDGGLALGQAVIAAYTISH